MITDITKIDKNFAVDTKIDKTDIKFYSAKSGIIDVYGLHNPYDESKPFHRLPFEVADLPTNRVQYGNYHVAGGRLKFKTNSSYVALFLEYYAPGSGTAGDMSAIGASGMDVYIYRDGKPRFYKSCNPKFDYSKTYERLFDFGTREEREFLVHLPLYNNCKNVYIGIEEAAEITHGSKYTYDKPIVYYGSSITQGGCATRPGNAYTNMISRHFDVDQINLGFSGNCKGEAEIAQYIAGLDMSIFVLDYDHNAPDAEHLKNTHEAFFKTVRNAHPELPIIIMTKTDIPFTESDIRSTEKRKAVIKATYDNAVSDGDKNVYFVDGQEIFKLHACDDCTVDGCHPNDIGFYCMAQTLIKVIEDNKLLK